MTTTRDRAGEEAPSAPVRRSPGARASTYPRAKRVLDLLLGSLALLASGPLLVAARVAMVATGDRGPFLYRAQRVGENGRLVTVFKIRTMTPAVGGAPLTSRDDTRVTRVGSFLRRYKLDELPQLWNVVRGEMALVGPRPEDPSYVDMDDPLHRRVFTARPGITGLAQLAYRHESELLVGPDADRRYRESILPAKLQLDSEYLDRQSVRLDLQILGQTAAAVVAPRKKPGVP